MMNTLNIYRLVGWVSRKNFPEYFWFCFLRMCIVIPQNKLECNLFVKLICIRLELSEFTDSQLEIFLIGNCPKMTRGMCNHIAGNTIKSRFKIHLIDVLNDTRHPVTSRIPVMNIRGYNKEGIPLYPRIESKCIKGF